MSGKRKRSRIVFVQEIVQIDEEEGAFIAKLSPDPRRYEWKEVNGERYLYDKLDDVLFPRKALFDLVKEMEGCPVYLQPREIENHEQYVQKRAPLIRARLKSEEHIAVSEDKSEAFLEPLTDRKLGFGIMVVDIVGSTKLSTKLNSTKYSKLISTTLFEMSEIIPRFHGHVLKYTGDGLIAYFPEPSLVTKDDPAIECALAVRRLVYNVLNPLFEKEGYPRIDIRIGLDSGEAHVVTIGSPKTKRHQDIIGEVVNLTTKIQSVGSPGDIALGDVKEKSLHRKWREKFEEIKLGREWVYKDENGKPYRVHRVKLTSMN